MRKTVCGADSETCFPPTFVSHGSIACGYGTAQFWICQNAQAALGAWFTSIPVLWPGLVRLEPWNAGDVLVGKDDGNGVYRQRFDMFLPKDGQHVELSLDVAKNVVGSGRDSAAAVLIGGGANRAIAPALTCHGW